MKKIIGFGIAPLTALTIAVPQAHAGITPGNNSTGTADIELAVGNFAILTSLTNATLTPDQTEYTAGTIASDATPGERVGISVNTNSGTGANLKFNGEALTRGGTAGAAGGSALAAGDILVKAATPTGVAGDDGTIENDFGSFKAMPTTSTMLWKNLGSTSSTTDEDDSDISLEVKVNNLKLYPGGATTTGKVSYKNRLSFIVVPN